MHFHVRTRKPAELHSVIFRTHNAYMFAHMSVFAIAMGLCLMSTPALYGKIPVEVESDVWTGGVAFILVKTILLWIVSALAILRILQHACV